MTDSTDVSMKSVFDELYQLHINTDKESKREYAEKYNALTPDQQRNYLQYQSNYDVFNRKRKDAIELKDATTKRKTYDSEREKLVKTSKPLLNYNEKTEFRAFKQQQKEMGLFAADPSGLSRDDFDKMLDAAFEEMEKVDLTAIDVRGDNTYKPQKMSNDNFIMEVGEFNGDIGKNEVELRFGIHKIINGKQFFDSQVPKNCFENLLKFVASDDREPEKSTVYTKSEGKYKIRIIEDVDGKKLQRKSVQRTANNIPFGVRLQSSLEEELDSRNISKFDLKSREFTVRQRIRWTGTIGDTIKLDMTKVIDPYNRKNVRYEVEVEFLKPRENFNQLVQTTTFYILRKMQNTETFTTNANIEILMNNYNSIFTEWSTSDTQFEFPVDMSMSAYRWGETDIIAEEKVEKKVEPYTFVNFENKPIAFDYKNIFSGCEYYVTPKLDGLRTRIFIDVNGVYEIDVKTGYVRNLYSSGYELLAGTVIDCEYYEGEYYPFDVLSHRGVNLISKNFDVRFSTIRKVINGNIFGENIPGFNYSKPFYFEKNPFDAIARCFQWMDTNNKIAFDGLIFQRNDEPYRKSGYATNSMKWKPLDEITVDLYTRIMQDGSVEFYSVDPSVVGGNFSGLKLEYSGTDYNNYEIPEEARTMDTFIAEYYFVDTESQLLFKQLRRDKTEPNFHKVVKSNRTTFFYDKVGKSDLLGYTLQSWRKWASSLKRSIVESLVVENSRVLDIGVGRGGGALYDLSKKCSKVYGIDPDSKNLDELRRRLEKFDDVQKSRVEIAKLKGQDTTEIVDLIGNKVDVITMFFSISFFYESEADFDALIDTIDQAAKKGSRDNKNGSMLIVQMMDGDKIHEMTGGKAMSFSSDPNPDGTKLYKIRTTKSSSSRNYSTDITISLPSEKDTILGDVQKEWIASPETLIERLAEIGFVKLSDDSMDNGAILPKSNMDFASLNRSLVFIRGGGVQYKLSQKFNYYDMDDEENFMSPLPVDSMETFTVGKLDLKRVGVKPGKDSFLASVLYAISSKYRDDVNVRNEKLDKIRKNLKNLLDSEVFQMMLNGNVAHNIAFETLYTKEYDTIVDGAQVDVVNDIESSRKVAFLKYLEIISNGYVGHEIADIIGCFWDRKIVIYGENGKKIYTANSKSEKTIRILKIANIGYEPIV